VIINLASEFENGLGSKTAVEMLVQQDLGRLLDDLAGECRL
jgi:hypothetical protein